MVILYPIALTHYAYPIQPDTFWSVLISLRYTTLIPDIILLVLHWYQQEKKRILKHWTNIIMCKDRSIHLWLLCDVIFLFCSQYLIALVIVFVYKKSNMRGRQGNARKSGQNSRAAKRRAVWAKTAESFILIDVRNIQHFILACRKL